MKNSFYAFIAVSALFLYSCKQADSPVTNSKAVTYSGTTMPFGGDSIRSWMKGNLDGNIFTLTSMGVTFPQQAYSKLEMDSDMMFMMDLPITGGSLGHIEVDWNPHGDPKPSLYTNAHLDVHFFYVDTMKLMAVMAGTDTATSNMDKKYLPPDYKLDPFAEAGMGVHAFDTTGKEFGGQPFDYTVAYGYYHGDLYFIEPMIAKTFLDSKPNISPVIKQPVLFRKNGVYPTEYSIAHDPGTNTYTISINNFVSH
jgi:hypothetical protein